MVDSKLVVLEAYVWESPGICLFGEEIPRSATLYEKRRAGLVWRAGFVRMLEGPGCKQRSV